MEAATRAVGVGLIVLNAAAESDLDAAFKSAAEHRAGALLVSADPFFTSQRARLVTLAQRYALPAAYPWREYAQTGGLMSYGPSITHAYQQIGGYAGRILKGAKVSELPVQLPTRFELILNLKTAKESVSPSPFSLLATADEAMNDRLALPYFASRRSAPGELSFRGCEAGLYFIRECHYHPIIENIPQHIL